MADDLLGAMEIMELMTMQDRYFSPEQRAALDARAQELGAGRFAQAEAEWSLLIAEVGVERKKGTPPSDARVLALAARWKALIEQFTGGDPGIRDSLATMYHAESAKAASRGTVPDEGLMAYIGEAMGHLT